MLFQAYSYAGLDPVPIFTGLLNSENGEIESSCYAGRELLINPKEPSVREVLLCIILEEIFHMPLAVTRCSVVDGVDGNGEGEHVGYACV